MNQTIDAQNNPPESKSPSKTILVVEDEPAIGKLLRSASSSSDDRHLSATNLSEALQSLEQHPCDAVVVDLQSRIDVVEMARQIRASHPTPVILVFEHGQEERRSEALFAGADDFIANPFRPEQLQSKINDAIVRGERALQLTSGSIFEMDRLKVIRDTCKVFVSGEEVHLTPTEYRLLMVLIDNVGRIITHKQFLLEVWGQEYLDEVQYLRIYVGHLRKKLGDYRNKKKLIQTEPRIGYRLAIQA